MVSFKHSDVMDLPVAYAPGSGLTKTTQRADERSHSGKAVARVPESVGGGIRGAGVEP